MGVTISAHWAWSLPRSGSPGWALKLRTPRRGRLGSGGAGGAAASAREAVFLLQDRRYQSQKRKKTMEFGPWVRVWGRTIQLFGGRSCFHPGQRAGQRRSSGPRWARNKTRKEWCGECSIYTVVVLKGVCFVRFTSTAVFAQNARFPLSAPLARVVQSEQSRPHLKPQEPGKQDMGWRLKAGTHPS